MLTTKLMLILLISGCVIGLCVTGFVIACRYFGEKFFYFGDELTPYVNDKDEVDELIELEFDCETV